MKDNKEDSHILFKDLDLLYQLMPSNNLALGLYEFKIWKVLFGTPQDLPLQRRTKKTFIERRQVIATVEKVWSISSTRRKSSSSQNSKHSHTHTLTHSLTHSLTHRTTAIPSLLTCSGKGNYPANTDGPCKFDETTEASNPPSVHIYGIAALQCGRWELCTLVVITLA